jgi:hypothetical protein
MIATRERAGQCSILVVSPETWGRQPEPSIEERLSFEGWILIAWCRRQYPTLGHDEMYAWWMPEAGRRFVSLGFSDQFDRPSEDRYCLLPGWSSCYSMARARLQIEGMIQKPHAIYATPGLHLLDNRSDGRTAYLAKASGALA